MVSQIEANCLLQVTVYRSRVGFGVTEALRVLQGDVEIEPLVAHLGQDEVGGAVDDPGDPLDAVGREALAKRLD